jgi:hypothetical protein
MNKSARFITSALVLCSVLGSASALAAPKAKDRRPQKTVKAPKRAPKPAPVQEAPAEEPAAAEAPVEMPVASTTTTSAHAPAPKEPATKEAAPAKDEPKETPKDAEAKAERRISVGAFVGAGFNETKIKDEGGNETREGVGTQGVGLGLRGGYTLPMNVYIGASFVYHLGGSKEEQGIKYTGSTIIVGPEVGYDLAAGPVVVRPYVGLGYGGAKAKAEANGQSMIDRSEGGFAIWPGVLARYPVDMFFVGVDARYAVITGTDKITNANGFGAFLTGGATF